MSRPTRRFAAYLFDLDGTLFLGDDALPGARDLIARLRADECPMLFLTNNPTRSVDRYVEKLTRLGMPIDAHELLNTVATMCDWLRRHHPDATVFPVAEPPLIDALTAAGIRISENPAEIDIVIASYDRTFDYRKLQIAFDAIHVYRRAILVTTNPDRFCPLPGGRGEPDAAAIVGAIEGCTGVRCSQNVGKPDRFMLDAALTRLGREADECIMIGDRLLTDIRMANDAGMASALVLTGDSRRADLPAAAAQGIAPDWVLDRIDQVLPDGAA